LSNTVMMIFLRRRFMLMTLNLLNSSLEH